MAYRRFYCLVAGLGITGAGVVLGARGAPGLPPLGALLDPSAGLWAVARAAQPLGRREITVPTFDAPVDVVVDSRGVPHVYAGNANDAYRALGFLVARDRLFQLEIQTRAAEGTLTELVGPGALSADRETRRLGFGR